MARLANQLSIAWPAVAGDVDQADFVVLTALQLAEPAVHAAIRRSAADLCGLGQATHRAREGLAQEYDAMLGLAGRTDRDRERLRTALRRLFPRLDSVWANTVHHGEGWRRNRLVASPENFASYFAYAPSEEAAPSELVDGIVERADDADFVSATFRRALRMSRRTGGTLAALLLDELNVHATDIADAKVGPLVRTLFAMADELDVAEDVAGGFGALGDNWLRLHWILNRLVQGRFAMHAREAVYRNAMDVGAFGWAADFARHCAAGVLPSDDGDPDREPIVDTTAADAFARMALAGLRTASASGALARHRRLTELLFTWCRLAGDEGTQEVRAWTDASLDDVGFVVALARRIPSSSFSFGLGMDGLGDRVRWAARGPGLSRTIAR